MTGPHKTSKKAAQERATKHCRFRLSNAVFGGSLIERMGEMNGKPSRDPVDLGAVNTNSQHWQDVASEFCGATSSYDNFIESREAFGRQMFFYVHDWLGHRPELKGFVEGVFPLNACVNTLRAMGAATTTEQHSKETPKRRRPASATLEEKILAVLSRDEEEEKKEAAVSKTADRAQAVHNGIQVIKDLKETDMDSAIVDQIQQA
ncbi:hypothetical protein GN958_ATG02818 [Phytophthora infestans]|nr:hypothetical protein GN958_ATG02818 [Phytophthora infestans]KAI9993176.1 hypothetical protein PInf_015247 [Phytophthora infestans]